MTARGTYRDRITWKQDDSAAGASEPTYGTTLAASIPCRIESLSGSETFRGRQLQENVDYVVEFAYYSGIGGTLTSEDRGTVTAGMYNGKDLHIAFIKNYPLTKGRPPITEVFCREAHS